MRSATQIRLIAVDGFPLSAKVYNPPGEARGAVLIAAAVGVTQNYYAAFADWVSQQGFICFTFDCRGIGESLGGKKLNEINIDILGWCRLDMAAALAQLHREFPTLPLYWIGHSMGGQVLPFVPHKEKLFKAITVATGSGYWRQNSWPLKRKVWWLWYFLVPSVVPLLGYFPGKRLRKVGDLPKGVILQWRRWCLNKHYAIGVEGPSAQTLFDSVHTPLVSLSFTDDEFMSAENTHSIHGYYRNAPRKMRRVSPQEFGLTKIGHFGFFRPEARERLWPELLLPELEHP